MHNNAVAQHAGVSLVVADRDYELKFWRGARMGGAHAAF